MFLVIDSIVKMADNEVPSDEVRPVRVKPETVEKLRTDLATLENNVANKQKVIDKLQSDLIAQQEDTVILEERIENLESVVTP